MNVKLSTIILLIIILSLVLGLSYMIWLHYFKVPLENTQINEYLISSDFNSNTAALSNESNNINNTTKNSQEVNTNNPQNVEITKQELEEFLSPLVGSHSKSGNDIDILYDFLYVSKNNEDIFTHAIQYLVLYEQYTKNGEWYIFKQSDIKELAGKYFTGSNFDYITTNTNFEYDSNNKTFRSKLQFGVLGMACGTAEKELKDFSVDGNTITAYYGYTWHVVEPSVDEMSKTYKIIINNSDKGLQITSVEQL